MSGILAGLIGSLKKAALSWTERSLGVSRFWLDGTYAFGQYWLTGNATSPATGTSSTFLTSADGISWSTTSGPATANIRHFATNGTTLIAAGYQNLGYFTTDGIDWSAASGDGWGGPTDAIWDGTRFIVSGTSSGIWYSTTGASWTAVASGTAHSALGYDGTGVWIALNNATSATHKRTTTPTSGPWTDITFPSSNDWCGVAYANGLFLANAETGTGYATSPDGTTWTARTFPETISAGAGTATRPRIGVHNSKFYLQGGTTGNIYSSSDGVTWVTEATGLTPAVAIVWVSGPNKLLTTGMTSGLNVTGTSFTGE